MLLTLIRHGIAEDKNLWKLDLDRMLTWEGRKKQLRSLEKNAESLKSIDTVICSPSARTRQTMALLQSVVVIDEDKIVMDKRIYTFSDNYTLLLDVIKEFSKKKQHLCLIGHNNGISALASYYAGKEVMMKKGEIIQLSVNS